MDIQFLKEKVLGQVVLISKRLGYDNPNTPVFTGTRVGGELSTTYKFTCTTNADLSISLDLTDVELVVETGPNAPKVLYIP
ncbi:MAG TPA: hypothetical protein DCY02_07430 [Armatimonadetes bacterium]|nr:hypothetical protein [Armatimonadota bacterium]HCM73358.1 hypothetical protein [Armatimonadota bacterium]